MTSRNQPLRSPIAEVLAGGLETTVQDYPGREGYLQLGLPCSGPMDRRSFQLGNQLLGNPESAAGLEIQFIGPTLKFWQETVIAIVGADCQPQLNQKPVSLWSTLPVLPGDILSFGHARLGARTYVQFAGGLDVPIYLNSRATFLAGGVGGLDGRKLRRGDWLFAHAPSHCSAIAHRSLSPEQRPQFSQTWEVEVLLGPHDDWLTHEDIEQFLQVDWQVSVKSNRTGYRLEGPSFKFAYSAYSKTPENGSDPSNKIDYGCPLGAVLFCGQVPTVLMVDGPSLTGYMAPFTVIESNLWKVGQARPGDKLRFRRVTLTAAQTQR
ncbi:MAG: biotin-dependent carboxyltransferase [Leptolyngbya sp. SIO4C1]|nr:biotin-dependent carboxyltransferase [Leptolyngbya sp. SIO4C1]